MSSTYKMQLLRDVTVAGVMHPAGKVMDVDWFGRIKAEHEAPYPLTLGYNAAWVCTAEPRLLRPLLDEYRVFLRYSNRWCWLLDKICNRVHGTPFLDYDGKTYVRVAWWSYKHSLWWSKNPWWWALRTFLVPLAMRPPRKSHDRAP